MSIRVVLVDDHETLRAGIRHLLSGEEGLEVVGEAATLQAAIEVVSTAAPDVIVLDLRLPDGQGFDLLPTLREVCASARVLVFSAAHGREWADRAMELGCSAFIDKSASCGELASAIRAVHQGRTIVSVADYATATTLAALQTRSAPAGEDLALSGREREILVCVARGLTNKEAASELYLSIKTVETYRSRLTRKLGVRTRSDLFAYAQRRGLVDKGADRDVRGPRTVSQTTSNLGVDQRASSATLDRLDQEVQLSPDILLTSRK